VAGRTWLLAVVSAATGAAAVWSWYALGDGPEARIGTGPRTGADDGEARRLREEVDSLRRRLAEAREALAARPAERPRDGPAAPANGEVLVVPALPPVPPTAAQVREWIEALRAAVLAGDGNRVQELVNRLATGGDAAAEALDRVVRDAGEPAALRCAALLALSRARPDGLGDTLALLLANAGTEAPVRAVALQTAAGPSGKGAAMRDLLRGILYNPAVATDQPAALAALVANHPEEAIPWVRDALLSGEKERRNGVLAAVENSASKALLPVLTEAAHRETDRNAATRLMNAIARIKDKPWSAFQMTGEPDTVLGGDLGTAWAAKQPEMGEVWIELDFAKAVLPAAVRVRETLAPGGVIRVQARAADGSWTTLWEGTAPAGDPPRWFEPGLAPSGFATRTIRLVLDTNRAQGWEEIDAVELVGEGLSQWAVAARASSSYAN
jgi:hypothetical protein